MKGEEGGREGGRGREGWVNIQMDCNLKDSFSSQGQ